MVSMLDASTIGFDLARLHCGAAVAEVLLDLLAISPGDLATLGRTPAGSDPLVALGLPPTRVPRRPAGQEPPGTPARRRSDHAAGSAVTRLGEAVRSFTVTSADALVRCLRVEVFAATWPERHPDAPGPVVRSQAAADLEHACCEAVREAWSGVRSGPASASWEAHRARLAITPVALGPQEARVRRVFETVPTLRTADLGALLAAHDGVRRLGGWAAAMHDATWAVHMSGRVRAAAVAQLTLARALHSARLPTALTAAGLWNALSGVTQALVVEDMLCDGSLSVLRDPYGDVLPLRS